MSEAPPHQSAGSTLRAVDPVALQRVQCRLSRAERAPWLHGEVARRMAQRLPVVVLQPRSILDWWGHSGASGELLTATYPKAASGVVEPMPAEASPTRTPWLRRILGSRPSGAWTPQDVPRGQNQLLWANMMLHWVADPQAEMVRWFDALAVDGFLMFSTLGPGTLDALRTLYAAQGWPAPHAPFVDMHDLGDMLAHAGFADPVMDQETLTLHWVDGDALLSELRDLGANVDPGRHAGLRTPRWRRRLVDALEAQSGERPGLRFEVVYGHAFKVAPNTRVAAETRVELSDMRSILRGQRDI